MAQFNIETNIGETSGLFSQFGGVLGNVGDIFGRVTVQVQRLTAAIASNPIGLLLVLIAGALAAVGSALSRFQPAVDTFNVAWEALGTAVDVASDNLLRYLGILDGSIQSYRLAIAVSAVLTRRSQELRDAIIENIVVEAQRSEQLQIARSIAQDVVRTDAERLAALERARTFTNLVFTEQVAQAEEAEDIARLRANISENDAEAEEILQMAIANTINIRGQQQAANRELIGQESALLLAIRNRADQITAIENSGIFQDRANADEEEIARLVRLGAQEDLLATIRARAAADRVSILATELEAAEEIGESEAQLHMRRLELITAETQARVAQSQQRIAIADVEMRTEEGVTDATLGLAAQVGDTLSAIAGDNKGLAIAGLVVGQAVSIASTIIDTVRANAAAAAASPLTAGQPFVAINTISAALGIASAIAATAQGIANINAAGGPPPTGGGAAPAGPTVNTPQGAAPGQNPMARMMQQMIQQTAEIPIAVVAQGDIRNSGERDARTRRKARLNRRNNG